MTELCTIMAEEGSDKSDISSRHHNYTIEYDLLFKDKRDKIRTVFEVGLGTNYTDVKSSMGPNGIPGASLRGWKRYFKNANIYGADIDKRILFTEDRIKTYYVDQTNKNSIDELWKIEELSTLFDIIIDDGLHEINANLTFLENSLHKLKQDGIYIIEDIVFTMVAEYKSRLDELKQKINFDYSVKILDHHTNKSDNCLIIITK
jgi:hypothetical protein